MSALVTERLYPNEKPSINTVVAAKPGFHFARFPGNQQLSPFLHQWRYILRMKRSLPAPTVRLFVGEACVIMPSFVKEFVRTIWQIAPGKFRDRVNHLPNLGFRILDCLLRESE